VFRGSVQGCRSPPKFRFFSLIAPQLDTEAKGDSDNEMDDNDGIKKVSVGRTPRKPTLTVFVHQKAHFAAAGIEEVTPS